MKKNFLIFLANFALCAQPIGAVDNGDNLGQSEPKSGVASRTVALGVGCIAGGMAYASVGLGGLATALLGSGAGQAATSNSRFIPLVIGTLCALPCLYTSYHALKYACSEEDSE